MTIHRLIATIAALGLLSLSSIATAHDPVDRLSERLELSESQAASISALFEAHRESMRAEFGDRGEGRERGRPDPDTRERMKEARDAFHLEVLAVLDAEQAEEFEQMINDRRDRRRHRRQSR